jgi:hypothetical protein
MSATSAGRGCQWLRVWSPALQAGLGSPDTVVTPAPLALALHPHSATEPETQSSRSPAWAPADLTSPETSCMFCQWPRPGSRRFLIMASG